MGPHMVSQEDVNGDNVGGKRAGGNVKEEETHVPEKLSVKSEDKPVENIPNHDVDSHYNQFETDGPESSEKQNGNTEINQGSAKQSKPIIENTKSSSVNRNKNSKHSSEEM